MSPNAVELVYPFTGSGLTKEWWDYRSPLLLAGTGCSGLGPMRLPDRGVDGVPRGSRRRRARRLGRRRRQHGLRRGRQRRLPRRRPVAGQGLRRARRRHDALRRRPAAPTGRAAAATIASTAAGRTRTASRATAATTCSSAPPTPSASRAARDHDALVVEGFRAATVMGEAGNDVLVVTYNQAAQPAVLDDGDGQDIIKEGVTVATVEAGAGNDQIDVSGGGFGPDTVICGAGNDTVWVDLGDVTDAGCEHVLGGPAPTFPAVQQALADAVTRARAPGRSQGRTRRPARHRRRRSGDERARPAPARGLPRDRDGRSRPSPASNLHRSDDRHAHRHRPTTTRTVVRGRC